MLYLENKIIHLNEITEDNVLTDYYTKAICPGCQRFISTNYFYIHLKYLDVILLVEFSLMEFSQLLQKFHMLFLIMGLC